MFTPERPTQSLRVVFRVGVDDDVPAGSNAAAEAAAEWESLQSVSADALWQQHVVGWGDLWARGGVELGGNTSLAGTVNSSLYDILSSLRSDWVWSTGPGGLGTNGYCGHSFWDMETWMYPVLTVLHPDIAWAVSQYRLRRLGASMQRAASNNYSGAFWAWESGVTGLDTAAWRDADLREHHISADIPLAWRRFYYGTGNRTFLQEAWPALNQTCTFWACRFTRTDSTKGGEPPAGMGSACSAQDGVGNWTVHDVICPDESSGVVSDSVYTNAAGAATLQWCVEAGRVLGQPTPALWADIAAAPYMPLVTTLSPDGPVHNEYTGYANKTINQADVALLQYPLGLRFDSALMLRDLDWWATKTDFSGMFTGDAAYSAAYLALGDRAAADEQIGLVWGHLEPHFNAFKETADGGGTQHFITGNGGLLQTFVFGYPGLRLERAGVLAFTAQQPLLPPLGVDSVKLRGLSVFGVEFDLFYNATTACAQLNTNINTVAKANQQGTHGGGGGDGDGGEVVLELRTPRGGGPTQLSSRAPVCVPVQPLEVAVVGVP
jgi:trehalose/maltose hydrolase-like predicted phosphorylase